MKDYLAEISQLGYNFSPTARRQALLKTALLPECAPVMLSRKELQKLHEQLHLAHEVIRKIQAGAPLDQVAVIRSENSGALHITPIFMREPAPQFRTYTESMIEQELAHDETEGAHNATHAPTPPPIPPPEWHRHWVTSPHSLCLREPITPHGRPAT